jgi:hypothetical protein
MAGEASQLVLQTTGVPATTVWAWTAVDQPISGAGSSSARAQASG